MKKFVFILAVLLTFMQAPVVFCQEPDAINKIRQYYAGIDERTNNGSLYERTLYIEYPVIPAIGIPSSRITIYYDMIDSGPGEYSLAILKIIHYYQHAGRVFYEECLFSPEGEPVFCFDKSGNGDAADPDSVEWGGEARYYFSEGNVIRITADGKTTDNPRGTLLENGRFCLAHAKEFRDCVARMGVPKPFGFMNSLQ